MNNSNNEDDDNYLTLYSSNDEKKQLLNKEENLDKKKSKNSGSNINCNSCSGCHTSIVIGLIIIFSVISALVSSVLTSYIKDKIDANNRVAKLPYGNPNKITYIFGHTSPDTDTIVSVILMANLEKQLGNLNKIIPCRFGNLNPETEYILNYFNIEPPVEITNLTGANEIILVDHSSLTQNTINIKNAIISKVIDHHGISTFEYKNPFYFYSKPYGSTSTILYELYKIHNIQMTPELAGICASAIISNTLLLRSINTTSQNDINALNELSEIAGIDYEEFGNLLFKITTDLSGKTEKEIINLDTKFFKVNGHLIQIACVNAIDVNAILKRKLKIIEEMDKIIYEKGIELFLFYVIDIINMDSTFIVRGMKSFIFENAFNVTLTDNSAFIHGLTSRKAEIYPRILDTINKIKI